MNVLVTGASGHIGYHICKLLVSKGYNVKAFIRPSSFKEHLSKLPLEICYGDVLKTDTLKKAMGGVETIFHTAAIYKFTLPHQDDFVVKTAVEGTKNVFAIASESGVRKIIYTSSVATVGNSRDKSVLLDESHFAETIAHSYQLAKIKSEKLALELANKFNIYTVICNPSTVIGKNDYKPTPSNAVLLLYCKRKFFYAEAGRSLVDVEDVASGHVNALHRGRNLERYILSGQNIKNKDFLKLIRTILKAKGPLIKLNKLFLYSAALTYEVMSKVIGKAPLLTRERVVSAVGNYSYFDCSKARKELGYAPKELAQTLPSTIEWLLKKFK